ncbi:MAG: OmpA family protein [Myxococcota bacterium]
MISAASAQDGFDAWGFDPTANDGDVRDPVTVTRPGQVNALEWYAGGIFGFAKAPLYVVDVLPDDTLVRRPALDNVIGLDITAGFAPIDRLRIDVVAPLFLTSSGAGGAGGPTLGDVELSALAVPINFGEDGGLGVRPWISLPTGNSGRFLGDSGFAGGASVQGSYTPGLWTLTGEVGLAFRNTVEALNIKGSDRMRLGVAGGRLLSLSTGLNVEAHLDVPFQSNERGWRETPGEILASVRHRTDSGAHVLGGLGTSLTPGVGSAEIRLFIGGGYGVLHRAPPDTDGDGIVDDLDKCVDIPETFNGWKDDDGCPDELASVAFIVTMGGNHYNEPVSITGKGGGDTAKLDDPKAGLTGLMPETTWTFTGTTECSTGEVTTELKEGENTVYLALGEPAKVTFEVVTEDGIPIPNTLFEYVEQPSECGVKEMELKLPKGTVTADLWRGDYKVSATAEGFETRVTRLTAEDQPQTIRITLAKTRTSLEAGEIKILERVLFETDSAKIKPISFQLLDEVAAVLVTHAEIKTVEVQGHADERGSSTYNLKLSTDRAAAVRQYLVDAGVAADRLVVQGYGEAQPIQAGKGEAAWAQNRRVQFLIREYVDAPK